MKGPIAAVCVTVLDLGWIPRAVDLWEVPGYPDIRLGVPDFRYHLVRRVRETCRAQVWSKASEHFCAAGVEHGVDFTVFRKFHRALLKDGDYQRAAMLVTIAVGACWPEERLLHSGYLTDGKCPRCADEKESMLHRCWQCPNNQYMNNTAVVTTSHLRPQADG